MGKLTTAQKEWLQALGSLGKTEAKTSGLAASVEAVNLKADAKTAAATSSSSMDDLRVLTETVSAETKNTRKTPFGPRVPPVDDSDPAAPKVNTGMPHTDHDHLVDIHDREKDIHEQMLWMEVRKSAYYVDNGIVSLKVLPEDMNMDIVTLTVIKMRLKFTGGRKLTVMMNTVTLSGGGGRAMKYERRNGFIIPLDANGEPSYDEYNTPNVIICAKWVDGEIAERKQQRQDIAELTDTMGGAWGGLAGHLSSGHVESTSPGGRGLPRTGRKGRAGATGPTLAGKGTNTGNKTGGKPAGGSNQPRTGGTITKPPTGGSTAGKPATDGGLPPVSMKLNEGSKGNQGGGSGASFKGDGKGAGNPGGKKGGSSFKGGKGEPGRQVISNKQDGDVNKEGGKETVKPTPGQAAPGKTGGGAVKGGAPGGKPAGGSAPAGGPAVIKATGPAKPPGGKGTPSTGAAQRPSAPITGREKLPKEHRGAADEIKQAIETLHGTGQNEGEIAAWIKSHNYDTKVLTGSKYPGWHEVDLYAGNKGRAVGYRFGFRITHEGPKFMIFVKGDY